MALESPYASLLSAIPTERRQVEVLGSTTRYWVYGPADAPLTVVVVHGYRGEHHGIEPVIAQLPGIRFIGPDLPGFGESTPLVGTPHSVEGYAAWLVGFVQALGLGHPPVVLGHSFGSIVASRAVAMDGLRTPALILLNPIAISGLSGPKKLLTKATVAYYELASRLPERAGAALLDNRLIVRLMSVSLAKTKDPVLRAWIHEEHQRFFSRFASRDSVVEGFRASTSTDVGAFAAEIGAPTLLIAGRLDDITPVAAQYDLEATMPDATLVVIDDVGHLIHYELPHVAAAEIAAFLDRVLPGGRPGSGTGG